MKEPIALVGMGCRFPAGANNPRQFWDMICDKFDAISEVPENRWNLKKFYDADPNVKGMINTKMGGFLDQIDGFDADFFGISPREAAALDPQQRLLLEVVWETMEDAGLIPEDYRHSRTGVYVGCFAMDYKLLTYSEMQRDTLGLHSAIGGSATLLSNRVSHFFDFNGPSMSVDTACSSSMVAVHLACQAIRNGEADQAIAAGVNLIFKPEWTIATAKGGFLSPDGHCKAFDKKANGYVRSEGIGSVLLMPLSLAQKQGRRIYAVIRETASNQDGRTKGVTVPSAKAQAALMREVYAKSGIDPADVHYVEAHGTGTPTGDPIETGAIGEVFGRNRGAGSPCLIGSVKSNIGHLEAASGMAGLMKACLSLYHEKIPPNILFHEINPDIKLDEWNLRVVDEIEPFPINGQDRFVGVNSFGFGGSNVHVALQGGESFASDDKCPRTAEKSQNLIALSARSPAALRALAGETADFVMKTDADLSEIGANFAHYRQAHPYRMAFSGANKAQMQEKLSDFVQSEDEEASFASPRKVAFVCSGMGPQWWGMGRDLMVQGSVFGNKIREIDGLLSTYADWSLWEELTKPEADSRIEETRIAQPAIFAVQVALAAQLRAWGIIPQAVVGHSAGEVAAAHIAGCLSLEDAVCVIYHRSRLQHDTEGLGRIVAVGLGAEEAQKYVIGQEQDIAIGAINTATSSALAGDEAVLDGIMEQLKADKVFCKKVPGKVPYHSPKMDPLKEDLIAALSALCPKEPEIALYSTATGSKWQAGDFGAPYWFTNVRETVWFEKAMSLMMADGFDCFVELAPHPVLGSSIRENMQAAGLSPCHVATLRRNGSQEECLIAALGDMFAQGGVDDLTGYYPERPVQLSLPHYPWQRETYWVESDQSREYRLGESNVKNLSGPESHPLLGAKLQTGVPVWDKDLDLRKEPLIKDHKVGAEIVYPGAAYVECALAAQQAQNEAGSVLCLRHIAFRTALYLNEDQPHNIQLICDPQTGAYKIHARSGTPDWMVHSVGSFENQDQIPPYLDIGALIERCDTPVDVASTYEGFAKRGLHYGPAFQGIKSLHHEGGKLALARLSTSENTEGYILHPSLLDAAFQVVLSLLPSGEDRLYLPVGIDKLRVFAPIGDEVRCLVFLDQVDDEGLTARLVMVDEQDHVLLDLHGFKCHAVAQVGTQYQTLLKHHAYQHEWHAIDVPVVKQASQNEYWAIYQVGAATELSQRLQATLFLQLGQVEILRDGHDLTAVQHLVVCADLRAAAGENELVLKSLVQSIGAGPALKSLDILCPVEVGSFVKEASLAAFVRVIGNEYPGLSVRFWSFDLDEDLSVLGGALLSDVEETELRLNGGKIEVLRLVQIDMSKGQGGDETSFPAFEAGAHGRLVGMTQPAEDCFVVSHSLAGGRVFYGQNPQGETGVLFANLDLCSHVAWAAHKDGFIACDQRPDLNASFKAYRSHLIAQQIGSVGTVYLCDSDLFCREHLIKLLQTQGTRVVLEGVNMPDHAQVDFIHSSDFDRENLLSAALPCGADVAVFAGAQKVSHDIAPFVRQSGLLLDVCERGAASVTVRLTGNYTYCRFDLDGAPSLRSPAQGLLIWNEGGEVISLPDYLEGADVTQGQVIGLEGPWPAISGDLTSEPFMADCNGTYVISGGVRGFGLRLAEWLGSNGAGQLILLGRGSSLSPEGQAAVKRLQKGGCHVTNVACDVSDSGQVRSLFDRLKSAGHVVRGIFHAANIYRDGYLSDLSDQDFNLAYGVKAQGARNLHEASLNFPVDQFVVFSSISEVIGNAGQGNYVAANGYLSGLIRERHTMGLPGLSVNWGAIGDVGYLSENKEVEAQLAQNGIMPMNPDAALDAMGRIMTQNCAQVTLAQVDWNIWGRQLAKSAQAKFSNLMTSPGHEAESLPKIEELRGLSEDVRQAAFEEQLLVQVGKILGMGRKRLPRRQQNFAELGMDSMLSVELRNSLQKDYGCVLPVTLVFLYPSVGELVDFMWQEIQERYGFNDAETGDLESLDDLATLLELAVSAE